MSDRSHPCKTFVLSIFEWPLKTSFTVWQENAAITDHSPTHGTMRERHENTDDYRYIKARIPLKQSNRLSLSHQDGCKTRKYTRN